MEDTTAKSAPKYFLSKYAFICLDADELILLDLRKDKYYTLDVSKARGIGNLLHGWPWRSPDYLQSNSVGLPERNVVQVLVERGLLTADRDAGKDVPLIEIKEPQAEFIAAHIEQKFSIHLQDIFVVLKSLALAWLMLRLMPIERIVSRAKQRKRKSNDRLTILSVERIQRMTAIFFRLRPYLFTGRDACLFECLALSEFLAWHDIFPTWVFAVQSRPFSAHCWLQHEAMVLTDFADNVRLYTPIMVI